MKTLWIIGAGGHGKVAADIARKTGYEEIAFLDDRDGLTSCGGYPVRGKTALLRELDGDFIVAIGNPSVRSRFQETLEALGKKVAVLVHPSAVIGENVTVGAGTVIVAGAVVNPGTVIGKGCIVNTCASVDHDCTVGDYSHVAVGAHIAGTVTVGSGVWIGAGATVINNLSVCDGAFLGAGAVAVKNVTEPGLYLGVPAKKKHENPDSCK